MSFNADPEPTARPQPVHYLVSIATAIRGAAATSEGFIDHRSTRYYGTQSEDYPDDITASRAKERSNIRYEMMVNHISENISPVISQFETTADANSIGGAFSFVLTYDRPDYIYTWNGANRVDDPLLAIQRQVTKAFSQAYTMNRGLYLPPDGGAPRSEGMENITAASFGALSGLLSNVTVTAIDLNS